MSEKISRRQFTLRAGAASCAGALLPLVKAQGPLDPKDRSDSLERIEKRLAKPLSPKAKELTLQQLENNATAVEDRYKFDLPENSEPCFIYVPTPARKQR
jgi:hypothetical protein